MLKLISRYPISRRLLFAFALAAIVPSLLIAILGLYNVNQLVGRQSAVAQMSEAQTATSTLAESLHQMYQSTRAAESQTLAYLLAPASANAPRLKTGITQNTAQIAQKASQFNSTYNQYITKYDPQVGTSMPAFTSFYAQVSPNDGKLQLATAQMGDMNNTSWPQYQAAQAKELALLQQIVDHPGAVSNSALADQITQDAAQVDTTYADIYGDWNNLDGMFKDFSNTINGGDNSLVTPGLVLTAILFLLTLVAVSVLGAIVQRSITLPLDNLVLLTRRISKGDRRARASTEGTDEIAIVAQAMNGMLDSIVQLVQETQNQHDLLQGQVEKLVSEVSGVGDGDLRVSAEVTADALGVLADSFNYMVEELSSLVVRVKKMAREVGDSSNLTTERMSELVEAAERQIKETESCAIEIERMAQSSQQAVQRALGLASSSRDARASAQGGRMAVRQTIEGISRIQSTVQETSNRVQTLGERSREVNNIVDAISTIAHQTNRLALDAAIQAAMAGENGKGFGAVAADIRRLAERAKELASSVNRIVRSVREDIGAVAVAMNETERETSAGNRLAVEAGTALESIVTVIERQAGVIEGINYMAAQQQQSSNVVVEMMQHISESTDSSAGSTRAVAQNIQRVARLAEQLLDSVELFRLRDGAAAEAFVPAQQLAEGFGADPYASGDSFQPLLPPPSPVGLGNLFSGPLPVASEPGFGQFTPPSEAAFGQFAPSSEAAFGQFASSSEAGFPQFPPASESGFGQFPNFRPPMPSPAQGPVTQPPQRPFNLPPGLPQRPLLQAQPPATPGTTGPQPPVPAWNPADQSQAQQQRWSASGIQPWPREE